MPRPLVEFTEQQLAELEARYLAGTALAVLALQYGICQQSLAARLRARGVTIRHHARRRGHAVRSGV